MKKWALLIFLFLPLVHALTPSSVLIDARFNGDGTANVTEVYSFPSSEEENLSNLALQIGYSYFFWKKYVEGMSPHVCGNSVKDSDITIILKEYNGLPSVLMTYACHAARKVSEDLLWTTFTSDRFYFPVVGGLMTLPENYTLTVTIPSNGRFTAVIPPATEVEKTTVTWEGPVSTAKRFQVTYAVPKVYVVPSISYTITSLATNIYILTAFFVLLAISLLFKERLKEKVSEWAGRFTEFEGAEASPSRRKQGKS